MTKKIIGHRPIGRGSIASGVGYIVVPMNEDRERYIKKCFDTGTVSIICERTGSMMNKIKVSLDIMEKLEFPEDDELGSMVAWINIARFNKPILIAIISKADDYIESNEHKFNVVKKLKGNVVSVSGDVKEGVLNLNVDGEGYAEININVAGKNNNGKLNIHSNGEIELYTENKLTAHIGKDTKIEANTTEVKIQSKNVNVEADNVTVKGNIKHNEGSEAMMLGDSTIELLNKLITNISKITVLNPETSTPLPIVNLADFSSLIPKLNSLLSRKSKLD